MANAFASANGSEATHLLDVARSGPTRVTYDELLGEATSAEARFGRLADWAATRSVVRVNVRELGVSVSFSFNSRVKATSAVGPVAVVLIFRFHHDVNNI